MQKLLCVVMDGVGFRSETYGNAVKLAYTPHLNFLCQNGLFTQLKAHGTHVGLPSDDDIGNSEVGHNTLGGGRVFAQGAKLVQNALHEQSLFKNPHWKKLVEISKIKTLHFIGLLSDGNVHSHERHLHQMLEHAVKEGAKQIRLHILLDGRDVAEKSAEIYIDRLEALIAKLNSQKTCDIQIASGGGRMHITMDRYEADWAMVKRGWDAHVLGRGQAVKNASEAIFDFRKNSNQSDQYVPAFVVCKEGKPVGIIQDGDGVIFFNFRGDRAIEISKAFTKDDSFDKFDRERTPDIFFAGMMQYDGDEKIPAHFLVDPPAIKDTLSEYMIDHKVKQFACSETQKFGHVTYFWNGNFSGYLNKNYETYLEVPSDNISFDLKPWMKAYEITEETIKALTSGRYDFLRINYANGDMVGHTGNLEAATIAVSIIDLMLGRLIEACRKTNTILVVTADHGNCDEMLQEPGKLSSNTSRWSEFSLTPHFSVKTAHSKAEVPFIVYGSDTQKKFQPGGGLAHVANTILELMQLPTHSLYTPSLLIQP